MKYAGKKEILYIGNILSEKGGSVSVIETLAPRLSEFFNVKIYSNKKNQLIRLLSMLFAVLRHSAKAKFVLIDSYSSPKAFTYSLLVAVLCRVLRLSYIPILHGGDYPSRLKVWPLLCSIIFKKSHAIVAPSGYLKDAFESEGYSTILIPNFIDIKNYPFCLRHSYSPSLLWVRAFNANTYNPFMAIRVLHLLVRHHPNANLCMIGPDNDGCMVDCKVLAQELGIEDRVRFTGRLSKTEWIALSRECNIFINTSNVDNTPVSVIEAMALGLPVVSTKVGGVPYLIKDGENGLLSPKGDIEAFALQVHRLINDSALANKICIAARSKAESFSYEKVMPLWKNILSN